MLVHEQNHKLEALNTDVQCIGFQELKNWQVQQYRRAVDDHRHHLSLTLDRCVGWHEAEQDFCRNDCDGHAKKWRTEYCGLICPSKSSCLLALHFLRIKKETPLHRVG
jgi:hypothetical protein